MLAKNVPVLLVLLLSTLPAGAAAPTTAPTVNKLAAKATSPKVHKAGQRKASSRVRHGRGAYLVPPPPAYMPSILPEELAQADVDVPEAPKKPENPYKKYVYSKSGYEMPQPQNVRSGVVTFTSSNSVVVKK